MMFNFFKNRKKINTSEIKNFQKALNAIKGFISFQEYDKSIKAINEIIKKETDAFIEVTKDLDEKNTKKLQKSLNKKVLILNKLKQKVEKNINIYDNKISEKKKKEEIRSIQVQLKSLISQKENIQAIKLLKTFIEGKSDDVAYVNLYNRWRKIINLRIEKQKKLEEKLIKKDVYKEAQKLIGDIKIKKTTIDNVKIEENILQKFKNVFKLYSKIKKNIKEKKILDEINILLKTDGENKQMLIKSKLGEIHGSALKSIDGYNVDGYDVLGHTKSLDKISGDVIGFSESNNDYKFFIGDATGHGIKAGFTASKVTKVFTDFAVGSDIIKLAFKINNELKKALLKGYFVTSVFFQINKEDNSKITVLGMGHEPIYLYKKKENIVEKIIAGGLAAGIIEMKSHSNIKVKDIEMKEGDILFSYTDGIIEAKNEEGEMYGFPRLEKFLKRVGEKGLSVGEIKNLFYKEVDNHMGTNTIKTDDISLLLFKRNTKKDILNTKDKILSFIEEKGLDKKQYKKIKGKNLGQAQDEAEKFKKENALKFILKNLDNLYRIGELPKLKQECIRYIKEGFIHKKLNYYLRLSIDNEHKFKLKQKNKRIQDKMLVLQELYKKGEYEVVVGECAEIIKNDGGI